ncbi:MAG: hypothetical protein V4608_05085 [Bacteroidota bacterium]
MKKLTFITMTLYVTAAALTGCDSNKTDMHDENKEEKKEIVLTEEHHENTTVDYNKEYDDFKRESDERIAENDRKIEEYNKKIEGEKKEAKAEYKEKVAALNQKNKDMKDRVNNYKVENGDKWESFKREFNHDMDELGNALRDLGKDNKK